MRARGWALGWVDAVDRGAVYEDMVWESERPLLMQDEC